MTVGGGVRSSNDHCECEESSLFDLYIFSKSLLFCFFLSVLAVKFVNKQQKVSH
jgi:hypothetical protein